MRSISSQLAEMHLCPIEVIVTTVRALAEMYNMWELSDIAIIAYKWRRTAWIGVMGTSSCLEYSKTRNIACLLSMDAIKSINRSHC